MIVRYESIAAIRAAYLRYNPTATEDTDQFYERRRWGGGHAGWFGGESTATTVARALTGDTALVPAAEALLTELDTHIETPRRVWNRSPVGPIANPVELLQGVPTPMRRPTYEMDETAPITILATTTSSAGIDAKTLARRGTVILALVMALSRIRPVSLEQLTILDGRDEGETVITAKINTNPLDLATACYVLTSAGFARRLTYDLARSLNDFQGGWPRKYKYGDAQQYYDYLRGRLAPQPDRCLIIGSAELHDRLLSEPLEWIQEQITRFTHMQEEEQVL